ncbi:hypothetical protein CesoFtcFv8_020873 [Champsocephalus esox]|uniref:Uncharacterized protein n=1 Tax=Champsocephalus esox TaxID=159716 RepID=A0AAN8BD07_9TELE|nr:hypothetical protein CesoFtcFv8_020873 [Champsocephalus esox]
MSWPSRCTPSEGSVDSPCLSGAAASAGPAGSSTCPTDCSWSTRRSTRTSSSAETHYTFAKPGEKTLHGFAKC